MTLHCGGEELCHFCGLPKEEMEAHGVEIIYPDKQPFMDAAAPMIERFKNDPVFHDLIDQIQNTHEKDN